MRAVGIDIGTTSLCLVLYEKESGRILESLAADNAFLPGSFCQDPERIVQLVSDMLNTLLERFGSVDGVGVTSQMHGILYVDDKGKAVSDFYTWKESAKEGEQAARLLSESTGYSLYAGYGTVTHFCLERAGKLPESAVCFVNIGDYLVMRLCGLKRPKTDPTMAASFGGYRIAGQAFDFSALSAAGVNTACYPPVETKGSPAGFYKGIPVFWAVGDNQAGFYAAAGEAEDTININVGTGSQVSLFSGQLKEGCSGEIRPFVGKGYLYVQASVNGGKVYEKLAAFFEETIAAFTGMKVNAYDKMKELGLACIQTDLQVRPSLYGARGREEEKGSLKGLTEENFHPQNLIRAYVAGMAEELYRLYEEFPEELKKGRCQIVGSGNGIRRNVLLQQEVERIFHMPVTFSEIEEEAAAGAALIAMHRLETA